MAFADGDLQHFANNYDSTKSTSEDEFAGYITNIDDNFVYYLVKNKTVIGDEIEFITIAGENIKLKIKSLINSKNNNS